MNNPPVILIPDHPSPNAEIEQKVFGSEGKIIVAHGSHHSEISDQVWADTDAILVWHWMNLPTEAIAKLERCKVIVRIGVGFDSVDIKAAGKQGIQVCNVPDYGTSDVADHAIALMLTLSRGLYAFSENIRQSNENWHWQSAGTLHRLAGATIGIIGLGRIGTAAALRAKAFGMRVLFYDPYAPDGRDKALGITRCDQLEKLAAQSDVVSIHAPLTEETQGMLDEAFFAQLKPGAIIINTARGAIIDLDALAKALKSGVVRAAGLDVLPQEPPDPNHPLIKAWHQREPWIAYRLMITPHAAFYCQEAFEEMRRKAALEVKGVLEGKPARNCINQHWLSIPSQ